jgi:hypothetical protein
MRRLLFLIFLVVLLPPDGFCGETVRGHYCYTCREGQDILEAGDLTRTLAVRNAVESWKGFSDALGPSIDPRLAGDIIQVIGSGYLTDLKVVDQLDRMHGCAPGWHARPCLHRARQEILPQA